ncbi:hypothetical protein [uncultured Methylobacterium sp.]|uniref:hypothetical protein n=1 Tax=uncultured Methylobacterium sp. TaxID=157278 RepID=UPI0035CC9546
MNPEPRPSEDETARAPMRRGAAILPFALPTGRRFRRAAESTGPDGEILLFTGVRYERPAHHEQHAVASTGERRRQPS